MISDGNWSNQAVASQIHFLSLNCRFKQSDIKPHTARNHYRPWFHIFAVTGFEFLAYTHSKERLIHLLVPRKELPNLHDTKE